MGVVIVNTCFGIGELAERFGILPSSKDQANKVIDVSSLL